MKQTVAMMLAAALLVAFAWTPEAFADSNAAESHTLPVLVSVNAKGEVTDVAPAYNLRPAMKHLLKDTLNKMITKPAMNKGKAVDSQFVITLAVLVNEGAKGKVGTTFKYLAVKSLPPGSWHWVRNAENRLALSSQSSQVLIKYPPTDMDTIVESGVSVGR